MYHNNNRHYNSTPTTTVTKSEDNEKKELERKKLYVRGLSGLKNMGNTCYMNSILQCISSLDLFREWLIKNSYSERLSMNVLLKLKNKIKKEKKLSDNDKIRITTEEILAGKQNTIVFRLTELLNRLWKENAEYSPKSFKEIVTKYAKEKSDKVEFEIHKQNDSNELLLLILDKIHEETKSSVKVTFRNLPEGVEKYNDICIKKDLLKNNNLSLEELEEIHNEFCNYKNKHIVDVTKAEAYAAWKDYVKSAHSIITDLFTGLKYSTIVCGECNNISGKFEPFIMLSVPIPKDGETTIDNCINEFMKEETLTEDNKYNCEICKKKVNATKYTYIWEQPTILIVHLMRFINNGIRTIKLSSKVTFPINNLNINKHGSDINKVNDTVYDLCSISEHLGSDWVSGHYKAYCKNNINKEWYQFDDDDVYRIPNEELEKEMVTKNAYILFYVKQV